MESKFKVGDKVVPVSKSVYSELEESYAWKKANDCNQPFLYVSGFDGETESIVCSHIGKQKLVDGDFFLESDLIHYVEPKK